MRYRFLGEGAHYNREGAYFLEKEAYFYGDDACFSDEEMSRHGVKPFRNSRYTFSCLCRISTEKINFHIEVSL